MKRALTVLAVALVCFASSRVAIADPASDAQMAADLARAKADQDKMNQDKADAKMKADNEKAEKEGKTGTGTTSPGGNN